MAATASILLYEENIITLRGVTRGGNGFSIKRSFQHRNPDTGAAGVRGSARAGLCGAATDLRRTAAGLRPGTAGAEFQLR